MPKQKTPSSNDTTHLSIDEEFYTFIGVQIDFWAEVERLLRIAQITILNNDYFEIKGNLITLSFIRLLCYKWMKSNGIKKSEKNKIRNLISKLEDSITKLTAKANDMTRKENSLNESVRPLITDNLEMAHQMERLGLAHKLVSHQELEELGGPVDEKEIVDIRKKHETEQRLSLISPLPSFKPIVTSNPQMAAQMRRLQIPHRLVSHDELAAMG